MYHPPYFFSNARKTIPHSKTKRGKVLRTNRKSKSITLPTSINYSFVQKFNVPARKAYAWCTDYDPRDIYLMKINGERKINKLNESTILLTDVYNSDNGKISKRKVVRLNPAELSWTNTYIAGPKKYSQFLYKITPDGRNKSRLEFVGLQLEPREMSKEEAMLLARKVRAEDSQMWRHLANAMEEELS